LVPFHCAWRPRRVACSIRSVGATGLQWGHHKHHVQIYINFSFNGWKPSNLEKE